MIDMRAVTAPKSDQINADDLVGTTMDITIAAVRIHPGTEQPISMFFEGSEKAYRPAKTMARLLMEAWGPDGNAYIGRTIRLYRDPSVKFGKDQVGGIRISHLSDIDAPLKVALTATRGQRKQYTVQPLAVDRQRASADALTIEAARNLIQAAGDLDALRAVWSRKAMAPFRTDLQADLDARKVELSGEGPADTQRGEQHTGDVADLIAGFERAQDEGAYQAAKKAFEVMRDGLDADDVARVQEAADEAAARVLA